ncbi:MAG: hybrid sensor histidine kinase/response regulator [Pseudomonadota bacterium]
MPPLRLACPGSWYCWLLLCLTGLARADAAPCCSDWARHGLSIPHFAYLPDTGLPDPASVLALPLARWRASTDPVFNAGFAATGFWLSSQIQTPEQLPDSRWLLSLHNAQLSRLSVYWWREEAPLPQAFADRVDPTRALLIPGRQWLVPVEVQPGTRYRLLIHLQAEVSSQLRVALLPFERYLQVETASVSLLYAQLGALLVLAAVCLPLAWILRDPGLLYYSLFMLGIVLTHASLQGLLFQWFGPHGLPVQRHAVFVALNASLLFAVLFTRVLMRAPGMHPFYPKLLNAMLAGQALILLLGLVLPADWRFTLNVLFMLACVCGGLVMSLHNSLLRQRAAMYYCAAMTIFFIGTFLLALNKLGLLAVNAYTENLQLVGSVLSSLVFLLAINERVRQQRRSKTRSKAQALAYQRLANEAQGRLLTLERQTSESLERQVQARTAELESAFLALEATHGELQQAKQAQEQSHREKARFFAAASHDIRQPLYALTLLVEHCESTRRPFHGPRADRAQDQSLARIRHTVDHLTNLVEALFDLSKLDNKLVEPQWVSTDLPQLLNSFAEWVRPLCLHQAIQLRVLLPPGPSVARTDATMLQRVLSILVDNALKHSQCRTITLSLTQHDRTLVIAVSDDGVGIATEQLPLVFEEFYQVHNAERDQSKGMGLGLSLCRRLVELLGYELQVQSRLGLGTAFQLSLDNRDAAVVPLAAPPANARLGGARILLVEDDVLVRGATADLLHRWQMNCRTAATADEADALLDQGWIPDLAIVDYRLPGTRNGLQLAARLRARFAHALPVLLLTGDLHLCADDSQVRVLYKPVKPLRLRAALQAMLAAAEPDEPGC